MEASIPSGLTPPHPATVVRVGSSQSLDSDVSAVETSAVNPIIMPSLRQDDSLFQQSRQYERLISGQESEMGEAPPKYTASVEMLI